MHTHQLPLGLGSLPAPVLAPRTSSQSYRRAPKRAPLVASRVALLRVSAAAVSPSPDAASSTGDSQVLYSLRAPTTAMAKSSFTGGGATLQRSKLDLSQKVQEREIKTDDGQGGGIGGKGIFNGGGGGDDGGDDDDDYFDDGGDGDGDGEKGFFRSLIAENYSLNAIQSVLQEWGHTITSLPLILQTAAQMGLLSSAQLVRFCAMDNRPTVTRFIARRLSPTVSRELVGRMMADPAFIQKLLMENLITGASSLWYELQQRGDRFTQELDLVAINTLGLMAASSAVVWGIAPNRSFGAPRMPWQRMLAGMPSHVFDACGPQRQYTLASRAASYAAKTGQMALVGALAGTAMSVASSTSTALRQKLNPAYKPSLPAPGLSSAALGLGGFMAISSNFRYQLVAGMDRYLFGHSNFLWSYLVASGAVRTMSHVVSQEGRLWCMGLPRHPPPAAQRRRSPAAADDDAAALRRQQILQLRAAAAAAASGSSSSTAEGGQPRPRTRKRSKRSKADRGFSMSAGAGGVA